MKSKLLETRSRLPAAIGFALVMALAAPNVQAQFDVASKWSDYFCVGQQVCAVGDFNRDHRSDIIAFVRNTEAGAGQGDAWVALSYGDHFGPPQKWSDWICIGQEVCAVGDFNGDGRDDVVAFVRNTRTGAGQGDAWVALSTGTGFGPAQRWSDWMCIGQQVCAVGDFNRDGRDDLIAFVRDTETGAGSGDAWVALSNGTGFGAAQKWSDWMCIGQQVCAVGDFNGDRFDDVVAFVRNTDPGPARGDAWVAFSLGTAFGPARKWSDWICTGQQVCAIGDFNGDRRDDAVAFVRDTDLGPGRGDAWVALAGPNGFAPATKWSDWMCIGQQVCAVGDFDGNGRDDLIAFVRNTESGIGRGDVWVALSHAPIL